MPNIEFTQYLRPAGRTRPMLIDRPEAIAQKAVEIIAAGYRLEVEELRSGDISLSIADDKEDADGELCENGTEVPRTVDRLIERFHKTLKARPDSE